MTQPAAIELRGVTKDFAVGLRGVRLRALDDLNLRFEAGLVHGLLGPNGSGKSTALKIALGLLEPTAGACSIFGVPSTQPEARQAVGYLPEMPYFQRHLTGRELVQLHARLGGLNRRDAQARVAEVLETVDLTPAADRRISGYSKGMLQRVGLAQALVHDPPLVILDEPTAGVDPIGTEEIGALIRGLKAQGKTVLITSHLLGQMEEWCDRVAILDQGRLLLETAVSDLQDQSTSAAAAPRVRLDRLFVELVGRRKGGGT